MIKKSSSFILEEFANVTKHIIDQLEADKKIRTPLHKEVLKFENTALILWLYRKSNTFPSPLHRLILDEMHEQYFALFKKHGYDKNALKTICDDLNLRYKTYDSFIGDPDDFSKIGTHFAKFISKRLKTDIALDDVLIPTELLKQASDKILEFKKIIN